MALPLSLQVFDAGPQRAQPVSRHNVIPFPSSRVQLPVTLLGSAEDDLDFTMHALITTLPYAMIGPLKRRHAGKEAR
jgi:hypothetical protein